MAMSPELLAAIVRAGEGGFRGEVDIAAEALGLDAGNPAHREVLLHITSAVLYQDPRIDPFTLRPPVEWSSGPLSIWTSGRFQRDWRN
jgi:hypothetical protein